MTWYILMFRGRFSCLVVGASGCKKDGKESRHSWSSVLSSWITSRIFACVGGKTFHLPTALRSEMKFEHAALCKWKSPCMWCYQQAEYWAMSNWCRHRQWSMPVSPVPYDQTAAAKRQGTDRGPPGPVADMLLENIEGPKKTDSMLLFGLW